QRAGTMERVEVLETADNVPGISSPGRGRWCPRPRRYRPDAPGRFELLLQLSVVRLLLRQRTSTPKRHSRLPRPVPEQHRALPSTKQVVLGGSVVVVSGGGAASVVGAGAAVVSGGRVVGGAGAVVAVVVVVVSAVFASAKAVWNATSVATSTT